MVTGGASNRRLASEDPADSAAVSHICGMRMIFFLVPGMRMIFSGDGHRGLNGQKSGGAGPSSTPLWLPGKRSFGHSGICSR